MQACRSKDTKPELALRSVLHGMGLRYRDTVWTVLSWATDDVEQTWPSDQPRLPSTLMVAFGTAARPMVRGPRPTRDSGERRSRPSADVMQMPMVFCVNKARRLFEFGNMKIPKPLLSGSG